MNRTLLMIAAVALSAGVGNAAQAADKTAEMAAKVCGTCHGPTGGSPISAFPRLAGQRADYLEAQLKAFRSQTRADPPAQAYMWAIAAKLKDQEIQDLARYYAGQNPAAGSEADAAQMKAGKEIYENGIPQEKVLTCISCHGVNAEGKDRIPRIAGQHAAYLVKQRVYFKSSQRGGAVHVMLAVVGEGMGLDEMEAVAAYVASR